MKRIIAYDKLRRMVKTCTLAGIVFFRSSLHLHENHLHENFHVKKIYMKIDLHFYFYFSTPNHLRTSQKSFESLSIFVLSLVLFREAFLPKQTHHRPSKLCGNNDVDTRPKGARRKFRVFSKIKPTFKVFPTRNRPSRVSGCWKQQHFNFHVKIK